MSARARRGAGSLISGVEDIILMSKPPRMLYAIPPLGESIGEVKLVREIGGKVNLLGDFYGDT